MNIITRIFRRLRNEIFRKSVLLKKGKQLDVDSISLNQIDSGYEDWFVHPCVRYIPNGFAGHCWWMVVTPYPHKNCKYENPILYYGVGNTNTPPTRWEMVDVVQSMHPEGGYNADGNLYFDGNKLWIIWKENDTNNTLPECGGRVIMGRSYDGLKFSKPKVFAHNYDNKSMYLASPVICKINGEMKMLGVYSPIIADNEKGKEKKPRSIAVYSLEGDDLETGLFKFENIAKQNYEEGFDFWHIDCFKSNEKYFCVVTPQSGNEIRLGISKNGLNYDFCNKPLLHAFGLQKVPYMYKSSGVLIGDQFHLFYPCMLKNKEQVHIFCTSTSFVHLLQKAKFQ